MPISPVDDSPHLAGGWFPLDGLWAGRAGPRPLPYRFTPTACPQRPMAFGHPCKRPFACALCICKKSPARGHIPTRISAIFATRRHRHAPQGFFSLRVLGAVAQARTSAEAERNILMAAAQRRSVPAAIRFENLETTEPTAETSRSRGKSRATKRKPRRSSTRQRHQTLPRPRA